MDAPALLQIAFADLHEELLVELTEVDDETLFWQPGPDVNHVGFLLWHIVRDEDTVISGSVLASPERWAADGWADRFGLDHRAQGTGFDSALLPSFRYRLGDLRDYAAVVRDQTRDALANLDAARLNERFTWSETWSMANLLTTGCLSHGWGHLGEIRQLRGLRGWRFRE